MDDLMDRRAGPAGPLEASEPGRGPGVADEPAEGRDAPAAGVADGMADDSPGDASGDSPEDELGPLIPPPDPDASRTGRVLRFAAGVGLFLVGTVLWITPVVTGAVPFWVGGAVLMGTANERVGRLFNRLDARLPPRARRLLRWRPKGSGAGEAAER